MNRRHFLLWFSSIGLSAAAGTLLGRPQALSAAPLPKAARGIAPTPKPTPKPPSLSLVYDRDYLLYEGPRVGTYWESPTRLQAIVERLEATGAKLETHPVRSASEEQITRAHTARYVKYIKKQPYLPQDEYALIRRVETRVVSKPSQLAHAGVAVQQTGAAAVGAVAPTAAPAYEHVVRYVRAPADAPRYTKLRPYEAAALAAGGAIQAVEQVMTGQAQCAFALVRPPGHHATRSRNMGFCVFNNAAVAARQAQVAHGAERVLIIDWDVHHGNGTQEIFYTDPSVFYFSTHQDNIYPLRTGKVHEVGAGAGRGYNMNVPLPPRTGDAAYLAVFKELLVPVAQAFKPDLIIVSAGQDAHASDFVAQMRVSNAGFAGMTRIVKELARELCDNKLVFVLEGGYNPKVTARAVETIVKELHGPATNAEQLAEAADLSALPASVRSRIAQVKQTHLAHWPCLS